PSLVSDLLNAHLIDAVDAHDASAISFTPAGTIAATDVQGALAEVAVDAAAAATANAAAIAGEASARADADALRIPLTQKGAANGVATLGADSKIPANQIPALALSDYLGTVASQ